MKRRVQQFLKALVAVLVAVTLPATTVRARGEVAAGAGKLMVIAVGTRTAGPAFTAKVLVAHATQEGDEAAGLTLESGEFRSAVLAGRQQRLAQGDVPAGLYRGLHLVIATTRDATETGAPPRTDEIDLRLTADFRVVPGEITTLFIDWDLPRMFDREDKPDPTAFNLRRPDETVRRLALYVTDEEAGQVIAVNRATDQVFAAVQVGKRPHGLDATGDGRRVYVANFGSDTVSVIDPRTHQVVDTLQQRAGCAPEDVALALDDRRVVVSCSRIGLLAIYDSFSNALVGEVELTRSPGRLAVTADGRTIYALLPDGSQLAAIDAQRLADAPRLAAVDAKPVDLAVDRLSGRVYVTHAASPVVSVFDAELQPEEDLQIGTPSYGVALERDSRRLYISGGDLGGVSLVAADIGSVARRWRARRAGFLVVDPDGRKLFAAGGRRGTLFILDRVAGKRIDEITVGKSTYDLLVVP